MRKAAPTILVVPVNLRPLNCIFIEPSGELLAADVKRHRRSQVIVDDIVNLAEREARDVAEVIGVKQKPFHAALAHWRADQFEHHIQNYSWNVRDEVLAIIPSLAGYCCSAVIGS